MLGQQAVLVEIATFIVAIGATVGALGVIVKAPFIRRPLGWLWRNLFGDPLREACDRFITAIIVREVPAIVDERLEAKPWTNGKVLGAVEQMQGQVQQIADIVTDDTNGHTRR